MEEALFKTRRFNFNSIMLILFGIGMVGAGCYLFASPVREDNPVAQEIFSAVLCIFGLALLGLLFFKMNLYEVYHDRIRILSFLGQEKLVLSFREIKAWTEFDYRTKNGIFYILTLYTDNRKIKIHSNYLSDSEYNNLKLKIIRDIPEDVQLELQHTIKMERQKMWVYGIFALCFAIGISITGNIHSVPAMAMIIGVVFAFLAILSWVKIRKTRRRLEELK